MGCHSGGRGVTTSAIVPADERSMKVGALVRLISPVSRPSPHRWAWLFEAVIDDRFSPCASKKNNGELSPAVRPVSKASRGSSPTNIGKGDGFCHRSTRCASLFPIAPWIGDPAIDGGFVPTRAMDADRHLPGKAALRDLAVEGGTGKPGTGKNGFQTNDAFGIGHWGCSTD